MTLLFSLHLQNRYNVKFLLKKKCFHNLNLLYYMKNFIVGFSHAVRLVKTGRQFVCKIV